MKTNEEIIKEGRDLILSDVKKGINYFSNIVIECDEGETKNFYQLTHFYNLLRIMDIAKNHKISDPLEAMRMGITFLENERKEYEKRVNDED